MSRHRRRNDPRIPGLPDDVDQDPPDDDEEEEEEEETVDPTSIEDLTVESDPREFDRSFSDDDANLKIQGGFDPVAGTRQVIPRVAYTINFNFVWDPEAGRWVPKKKDKTIDDFEDGDLSEYQGDVSAWSVVSSPVWRGEFAGRTTTNNARIIAGEALPTTPRRGDVFTFAFRLQNANTGVAAGWAIQDTNNPDRDKWSINIQDDRDRIDLQKNEGGGRTRPAGANVSIQIGIWYVVRVGYNPSLIAVQLLERGRDEVASFEHEDSTYDDGAVEWSSAPSGAGPDLVVDEWQIVSAE